ncbi:MAG: DUF1343 domain-containing protein [Massilibacteroides sp.]|nr:DUF1343 domain-containing protein [Massilibacteroides sp.]
MRITIFSSILISFLLCSFSPIQSQSTTFQIGAEQIDTIQSLLKGKRVGLVVNQTSILEKQKRHVFDVLLAKGINVSCVFAPEHGFRGNAAPGAAIDDTKDIKTGIPIYSIYGKHKKPSPEQLANIDIIVYDIQDVGARFFTYISTLHYVMEACAENHKPLLILDRPNPNDFVDGPICDEKHRSFVGVDPIPVLYGLSVGELAQMINGEHWLKTTPDTCSLTVIKIKNWQHGAPYWLPVKPSPNLATDQAIRLYPSLCFFEGTTISVGRGTFFPFEVLGYPDPCFGSFSFTPTAMPGYSTHPLHQDELCYGMDLRELPFKGGLDLHFLLEMYQRSGKHKALFFSRPQWFDLLAGTKQLRLQIIRELSEKEIRESWQPALNTYKKIRKKYLLYPDYNAPIHE